MLAVNFLCDPSSVTVLTKGVPSGLVVVVLVWVLRTLLPSTSSRDRPLGVPGEGFTGGVIDEGGTQIPLSTSEIDEF